MLEEKSKLLSYVLRHKPESVGISLDKEGWVNLLSLSAALEGKVSYDEILQIVAEDAKGRYTIDESPRTPRIRANQGHSIKGVAIKFKEVIPPVTLYHGTWERVYTAILTKGLLPMNRHHVHLSKDLATAEQVGDRHKGETVIFEVDTRDMVKAGIKFYISENGVYLTDAVPAKYLTRIA